MADTLVDDGPNTLAKSVESDEMVHDFWKRSDEAAKLVGTTNSGAPNFSLHGCGISDRSDDIPRRYEVASFSNRYDPTPATAASRYQVYSFTTFICPIVVDRLRNRRFTGARFEARETLFVKRSPMSKPSYKTGPTEVGC